MTNGLHLPASIPDLSISFSSWVDDVFINPLLEALRKAYPDVRHKRFEGGQFQTETIGIWLHSIPSFVVSAAREHGLDHTPSPDQPGQMAFFVSNALTRRTASDNWNATPKRYNEQGAAEGNNKPSESSD